VNNIERILSELDQKLDNTVELTLYGRAALFLGFEDAPREFGQSHDVDAVFWVGQAEELAHKTNFWNAIAELNEQLRPQELYIAHLFEEGQVILTQDWRENRVRLDGPWRNLVLYRLGNADLFLTKLMRYDPEDIADAKFIFAKSGWSEENVAKITAAARVPPEPEIREQFAKGAAEFVKFRRAIKNRVQLESPAIEAVTYDRENKTLDVEFRGGGAYRYLQVSLSAYRSLLKAESAGAFWNEIKGDHPYIELH
jgi:KTSC domain